jgi:hypothetical protein
MNDRQVEYVSLPVSADNVQYRDQFDSDGAV